MTLCVCVHRSHSSSLDSAADHVQIAHSLAFTNFVLERCQPYRVCDFFDEVSTDTDRNQHTYVQYVQALQCACFKQALMVNVTVYFVYLHSCWPS